MSMITGKCIRCGKVARLAEVEVWEGETFLNVFQTPTCRPCLDVDMAGAVRRREQFQELIATGVGREKANQILCRGPVDGKEGAS